MIISEKQIMHLMLIAMSHIELVGLVKAAGCTMNYSKEICLEVSNLLNTIARQQSETLKLVE